MYSIDTGKYAQLSSSLLHTKNSNCLIKIWNRLSVQPAVRPSYKLLHDLYDLRLNLEKNLQTTSSFFQQGIDQFEKIEKYLQTLPLQTSAITSADRVSTHEKESSKTSNSHTYITTDTLQTTHHKHTSYRDDHSIIDILQHGICGGIYAGFTGFKGQAGLNYKYAQANTALAFGKAYTSLDAKVSLFDKNKFSPSLQLQAEGSAMLAQAKAMINLGNAYVSATGEAAVAVGAISGSAKAIISKEEVSVKAEVGAAAVRGEVKGTISIFGIKISAVGIGELGAAGAGIAFSSKKGEFEFGGKASLLAGLGFKIKVTY